MAKKTLRRPTKEMMLAVNASIDGNTAEANRLVKEHKLSKAELDQRLELRDGEKYDLTRKGGRPKGSRNNRKKAGTRGRPSKARSQTEVKGTRAEDLVSLMDGRTKTATLLRIAYRVEELLEKKPQAEVKKIEKAMEEAEQLKAKYEEAIALIGE